MSLCATCQESTTVFTSTPGRSKCSVPYDNMRSLYWYLTNLSAEIFGQFIWTEVDKTGLKTFLHLSPTNCTPTLELHKGWFWLLVASSEIPECESENYPIGKLVSTSRSLFTPEKRLGYRVEQYQEWKKKNMDWNYKHAVLPVRRNQGIFGPKNAPKSTL